MKLDRIAHLEMTSKSLKDKDEDIEHLSPDKFAKDVLRCHNTYRYKHCSVNRSD